MANVKLYAEGHTKHWWLREWSFINFKGGKGEEKSEEMIRLATTEHPKQQKHTELTGSEERFQRSELNAKFAKVQLKDEKYIILCYIIVAS